MGWKFDIRVAGKDVSFAIKEGEMQWRRVGPTLHLEPLRPTGWCSLTYPHCDPQVLHAPGECEYCDDRKEWQELREQWRINFTGHYDSDKTICPSEQTRGIGKVGGENGWVGNSPTRGRLPDPEEVASAVETLQVIEKDLRHDSAG